MWIENGNREKSFREDTKKGENLLKQRKIGQR
jgi:hypothetical protein